jgi:6-phosphofructokinase
MRVAMLTGGGDCPGLNAVMRAVARKGERVYGDELIGFLDGWKGVLEGRTVPLGVEQLRGTLPRGGTVIGSSRTNPYKVDGGPEQVRRTLTDLQVDALVAIGGEDTLGVAHKLAGEGVPVIGVPKTIDNDLSATELTFGFDTAVQICVDAIDRLHTTAESHDRVMVVEVMGRHAGHIAAWAGIAGGATITLIPEQPFDVEAVCEAIRHRHTEGKRLASIVVISEGATPKEGSMELQSGELDASATCASVAWAPGWRSRSRSGRATRPASPRSATCSGAAPPPPSTACSPRASGWPPSTPCTTRRGGRWSRSRAVTWCGSRSPTRSGS